MAKRITAILLIFIFAIAAFPVSAEEAYINLVAGLEYTVETGEPVTMSYANYVENGTKFDVNAGQLTDGKTASNSSSSEGWYKAFRAKSRVVTFDLGAVCAISDIKAGFLHQKAAGIYAARYINVYLSDDGETYGTAVKLNTGIDLSDTVVSRREVSVVLPKVYSARYVKVEFSSDIFTFCDEISVYGSKSVSGEEAKVKPDKKEEPKGYLKETDGAADIIKLYNGYYRPDDSVGILSEDDILPYVAYLDTNGNIAGTMFDSVAFVPCHGDYPSGGRLVKTNGKPGAVMSDWEKYFEYTFKENQDIDALNNVVGRVYSELGLKGKYKVYLTLPYPTVIDMPFGDINGDGAQENCTTLEERVNIVKWFADKCIAQFKANNYENLELAGFYWLREEINYSDSDHEAELVKQVNAYADKKKLDVIFDAFYLSIGYDHWETLGFDAAVMQPNVAFTDTYTYFELGMLGEFAESVYNNHIGVEIETNEPSYFRGDGYLKAGYNYESYLYYGSKTGYMGAVKTYYQGANPGSFYDFCHADISTPKGIYLRRLYDLTYSFIHGVYKNEAPVAEVNDIELVAGDKRVTADIKITDSDSYWGDIQVEFVKMPEHGGVTVAASKKTLIFRADEGYVGEDSFVLQVSDGFNRSEEITVKVTVNEPAVNEASGQQSGESSQSGAISDKNGAPLWLVILLLVLGAAVVAVAVAVIVKKKK